MARIFRMNALPYHLRFVHRFGSALACRPVHVCRLSYLGWSLFGMVVAFSATVTVLRQGPPTRHTSTAKKIPPHQVWPIILVYTFLSGVLRIFNLAARRCKRYHIVPVCQVAPLHAPHDFTKTERHDGDGTTGRIWNLDVFQVHLWRASSMFWVGSVVGSPWTERVKTSQKFYSLLTKVLESLTMLMDWL